MSGSDALMGNFGCCAIKGRHNEMGLVGESLRTKNHGPKNHIRVGKSGSQGRKIMRNATTQNGPNRRFWAQIRLK